MNSNIRTIIAIVVLTIISSTQAIEGPAKPYTLRMGHLNTAYELIAPTKTRYAGDIRPAVREIITEIDVYEAVRQLTKTYRELVIYQPLVGQDVCIEKLTHLARSNPHIGFLYIDPSDIHIQHGPAWVKLFRQNFPLLYIINGQEIFFDYSNCNDELERIADLASTTRMYNPYK